jgi:NAD-dependent deacetylase
VFNVLLLEPMAALRSVQAMKNASEVASPVETLQSAAELLHQARYAVALTGAGISTPSGIPDFRSPHTGLWDNVDVMEVASMMGFRRRPEAFFNWVRPLAYQMVRAEPNPAHYALAQLEAIGVIKALITQNIDMLHSRAGSHKLYEVHGHLREATCVECFGVYPASDGFMDRFIDTGEIPRCPGCGGVLKPNVILFGEALPVKILHASQRAARECDVMLVAGSSLEVAPASELPLVALAHGAKLILVNYEPTYVDDQADIVMHADVAAILPKLAQLLGGRSS